MKREPLDDFERGLLLVWNSLGFFIMWADVGYNLLFHGKVW